MPIFGTEKSIKNLYFIFLFMSAKKIMKTIFFLKLLHLFTNSYIYDIPNPTKNSMYSALDSYDMKD